MRTTDLHPDLAPLAFLVGVWRGEGRGDYPTIAPFSYGEELTFVDPGRPFLSYVQRTWSLVDQAPLHAETGYWRMAGPGRVEVMLAHPTGITELLEGTVEGHRITLRSTQLVRSSTAKLVEAVERSYWLEDGALHSTLGMAAVGQPMQQHLSALDRRG